MTVEELYEKLSAYMPESLREEWDNDGIMCSPDLTSQVHRVLIALDVTEAVVDAAIERRCDLIISHHPLVFRPIGNLRADNPVGRKLIKLAAEGISVFSFHTRADKADGGVNDTLADRMELLNVRPLGDDGIGRIGETPEEMTLEDFAYRLKEQLDGAALHVSDGDNPVHTVALVGGGGKDYVGAAIAAGADTFVSGEIGYNNMEEAAERGINLIEAGHYKTEAPVTEWFGALVAKILPTAEVERMNSCLVENV